MLHHRLSALVAVASSATAVHYAAAQTCVAGLCFLDRAARGEITLGNLRGSIGVLDFDRDGFMDLYIADVAGRPNRLFRNTPSANTPGGRTFADATAGSGLDDADGLDRTGDGVVAFDYDNDGDTDLLVGGNAPDRTSAILYRNDSGRFTNVSAASGLRVTGYRRDSISAADFDRDGDLDVLFANTTFSTRAVSLFENRGDGTFAQRDDLVAFIPGGARIYAHVWNDFDGDGYDDVFVCLNDPVPIALSNQPKPGGGRRLTDATFESGFSSVGLAPMGIACGDTDNDGDFDLAITDAVVGTYYENRGGAMVRVQPFDTMFGWGTSFLDADNDGDLDNYQAGSFGAPAVDALVRNDGNARWTRVSQALNTTSLASQYSAALDFDNDGRMDLVTTNPGTPGGFVSIYHNVSTTPGEWTQIRLVGRRGVSRDAAGAVVRVIAGGSAQVRQATIGSSFTATEDPRLHFGLGAAETIERIEVEWPWPTGRRAEVFEGPFDSRRLVTLRTGDACQADFNLDGAIDFFDFDAFVSAFEAGAIDADVDGDTFVDFFDYDTFIGSFEAGC